MGRCGRFGKRSRRGCKATYADSFAVYWLLKRERVKDAEGAARSIADALARYPHWMSGGRQERELRRAASKTLWQAGLGPEQVTAIVEQLLRMLRRERA